MYSMVLMAALSTGVTAPDCHRCGGCCGCYGGYGYGGWGCYGGCYGCFGGCGGCWGGWGCGGGCGGCWGGYSSWGCMGCMGCYGGYGMGGYGMGGGYGGVSYPGMVAPGGYGVTGGAVNPNTGTGTGTGTGGEQLDNPKPNKNGGKETLAPTRAKLIVELPTDAKLFIDDMPMKTPSGVRTFNTPTLEPGQAYYYMVRIEYVREGKPVSETRRVIVRAGQVARADFKDRDADTVRTVRAK